MNFFEAQDNARRVTRRLVIAYVVATALIIAGVTAVVALVFYGNQQAPDPRVLAFTAAATALLILGASAYKTARLSAGGGQVARELGGTLLSPDSSDPLRRRLRNVVEEMAIASGVPVPDIYVLEQEAGINAFAAGFTTGDAAIAVTRGTLELLDRDELQGVIAHEFSHVLNGDMRLNIRLMGVLFGIMVLGLVGRLIVRGSWHSGGVSRRRGKGGGVAVLGIGLIVIGAVGVFFARLVKAAVSRQREYLADASAVQFTRQTDGIANALKKIAGYDRQSWITQADPEEVSHMLFAHGSRLSSLFATHPPLLDRIRTLQPGFRPDDLPQVSAGDIADDSESRVAGLAGAAGPAAPAEMPAAVGNPSVQHVLYAAALRDGLPPSLYEAAHSEHSGWLLVLSLFAGSEPTRAGAVLAMLDRQLGEPRGRLVRDFHAELAAGDEAWRLPLMELAFPVLRHSSPARLEYLTDLVRRVIELDGHVGLDEFCLYRVLERDLARVLEPSRDRSRPRAGQQAVRDAALALLGVIARAGHGDDAAAQAAWRAGLGAFGSWADDAALPAPASDRAATLGAALDVLERMNNDARRSLVQAVAATVGADGRYTTREAELLRAVCASLDCPLPPLAGAA